MYSSNEAFVREKCHNRRRLALTFEKISLVDSFNLETDLILELRIIDFQSHVKETPCLRDLIYTKLFEFEFIPKYFL